jgi:hypothetical protein
MTAEPLEARWIFPGQLETAVAGGLARFLAGTQTREDAVGKSLGSCCGMIRPSPLEFGRLLP